MKKKKQCTVRTQTHAHTFWEAHLYTNSGAAINFYQFVLWNCVSTFNNVLQLQQIILNRFSFYIKLGTTSVPIRARIISYFFLLSFGWISHLNRKYLSKTCVKGVKQLRIWQKNTSVCVRLKWLDAENLFTQKSANNPLDFITSNEGDKK